MVNLVGKSAVSKTVKKQATSVLQVNLSTSLTVCSCITNDNELTLSSVKEEKMFTRTTYSDKTKDCMQHN